MVSISLRTARAGWIALALLALPVVAFAQTATIKAKDMDPTCAPCKDFFQYANGGWVKATTIPSAYPSWGSFEELQARNEVTLLNILQTAQADTKAAAGSDRARIGTYYSACMDSAQAETAGVKPIEPLMLAIDGMKSIAELANQVAWLHAHGVGGLFGFRSAQDPKRSSQVIAFASQGGLGLPDRDYYTRDDSASRATRMLYVEHMARAFELAGRPATTSRVEAGQVMAIETELAKASMTNVQRRDPKATYHKMPLDSLRLLCPAVDWVAYLTRRKSPAVDSINVTQPEFFRSLNATIATHTLPEWQAYLRWRVVNDAAPTLTKAFADEDFAFEKVLTGAETMQPRWKRCLRATDGDLGDLLGREYVNQKFSPAARTRALNMVKNLEAALGDRIEALDWMGADTRVRAMEKLKAFENKIGYPDQWRDYAGVEVSRGAWYSNRLACRAYESTRNVNKIGKPVDRGEWNMTPPTVNAFYSSSLNSINFPAGILQPPFYDPSWDDALNYGGIGSVIGHEMGHGFDDRGRQFDAQGNLRDWWTADDATNYKARSTKVSEQFDGYTVLDTLHLNGKLTLGENIADLGGIAVAYHALQKALGTAPRKKIDGFTPEQRFFLSYARVWRERVRDEAMRTQVQTDPHSPGLWRVNGPLSNLPEFQKAFGCKAGDPMVRPDDVRARIF